MERFRAAGAFVRLWMQFYSSIMRECRGAWGRRFCRSLVVTASSTGMLQRVDRCDRYIFHYNMRRILDAQA